MIIEKATLKDLPMLYKMQRVAHSAIKHAQDKGDEEKVKELQEALLPIELRIEALEEQQKTS